jgi:hypothetical protein
MSDRLIDVMVDLETLGVKPGSVILSLGAVEFDPHGDALGARVHYHIDMQSSIAAGFKVDPTTFYWWLAQSDQARRGLINGNAFAKPLGHVLGQFEDWLGDRVVWAWGDMDVASIGHAFDALDRKRPWFYRNVRDARSIVLEMVDEQEVRVSPAIEHDALSDAIAQAKTIQNLYRILEGGSTSKFNGR